MKKCTGRHRLSSVSFSSYKEGALILYLAEHNRVVTRDAFYKIVNQVDNPQVTDVKCIGENCYELKTDDGAKINFYFKG